MLYTKGVVTKEVGLGEGSAGAFEGALARALEGVLARISKVQPFLRVDYGAETVRIEREEILMVIDVATAEG